MKHFTICSLVSLPRFQWKSMVIKLDQQKAALFIFLLHLVSVIVVPGFFFTFFWQRSPHQLIALQVILQNSDTHPGTKRVCPGSNENNISIIDQQLLTAAGFIVWSSMAKLCEKNNEKDASVLKAMVRNMGCFSFNSKTHNRKTTHCF